MGTRGRKVLTLSSLFRVIVVATIATLRGSYSLQLLGADIPTYSLRGETAQLTCDYDVGDATLYSVRWFKDDAEFFSFVPMNKPPYKDFRLPGLTVDTSASSAERVVLRGLEFSASGQFRCEVTTEGPNFNTVIGHGDMLVVEPPSSGPILTGTRKSYTFNDTVDVMCTSSPSRPPAHLSWTVNGALPHPDWIQNEGVTPHYLGDSEGLFLSSSRLKFVAQSQYFPRGVLAIKCIASLAPPPNFERGRKKLGSKATTSYPRQSPQSHHHNLARFFRIWENSILASGAKHASPNCNVSIVSAAVAFLYPIFYKKINVHRKYI